MLYPNTLETFFDKRVFAGPHPALFGNGFNANLQDMLNANIKVIYSFEKSNTSEITSFWQSKNQEFKDLEHKLKIGTTKITVPDMTAPSINQLTIFVSDVLDNLKKGKKVLLHCRGGLGRTGTYLAAVYLTQKECTVEEAIEHIRATYHKDAIETDMQVESLHLYKASLNNIFFGLDNF